MKDADNQVVMAMWNIIKMHLIVRKMDFDSIWFD